MSFQRLGGRRGAHDEDLRKLGVRVALPRRGSLGRDLRTLSIVGWHARPADPGAMRSDWTHPGGTRAGTGLLRHAPTASSPTGTARSRRRHCAQAPAPIGQGDHEGQLRAGQASSVLDLASGPKASSGRVRWVRRRPRCSAGQADRRSVAALRCVLVCLPTARPWLPRLPLRLPGPVAPWDGAGYELLHLSVMGLLKFFYLQFEWTSSWSPWLA